MTAEKDALCVRCEGDRVVALTGAHEPGGYGPCPDCQRPIPPDKEDQQ